MRRSFGALAGLTVLLVALLAATVDLHSDTHPDAVGPVSVDLAATHASETGHIESSETAGELLCPACLVLLQTVASPRGDSAHGTALEVEAVLFDGGPVAPLTGAACSTSSRAPPRSAA